MPASAASIDTARILLFTDGQRATGLGPETKVRRYRLARLRLDAAETPAREPRYAHLKRTYD